ncbi:MAG: filamentous hemagglutinin N-terminal domain-containing protein, partial [Endomicrobia bacterium]|nr:filamentous hemagglutinin N-terminal domain-containing protein [Endomicrobiia bacterium]
MKKLLTLLIAFSLASSPLQFVSGEILPHGTQVVVDNRGASNNIPVIQINTPNAKGISHNQFEKFNVDANGAVFNNVTNAAGAHSQVLNDTVEQNINLTAEAARVILNEIMSANPTLISGMVEIAGEKAALIVANPYGISVDGGSFINTSKVSLITGSPIVNAVIESFTLGSGKIEINNMNASESAAELVSRYVKLSGELKAENIDIMTGNDSYVYDSVNDVWNIVSSAAPSPADKIAVEATAFGSMYGNRIKIVATEEGFGVKMPSDYNLVSDVTDILIEADGKLELKGKITSKTDVTLTSNNGSIETGGEITGENINIEAQNFTNSSGEIKAADTLTIQSDEIVNTRTLVSNAYLNAGILQGDTINISGYTNANAQNISNYASVISSVNDLNLTIDGTLENSALLIPKATGMYYTVKTVYTNNPAAEGSILNRYEYAIGDFGISDGALIESNGNIDITAAALDNMSSNIKAGKDINLFADNIRNEMLSITATTSKIYYKYEMVKTPFSGYMLKQTGTTTETEPQLLYASAGSLINAANINILASDGISRALTLNNIGSVIKADNLLEINAQKINNEGISDINTEVQRGIKTSMIYTGAAYERRKLSLSGYERARVVHTATQGELSGLTTEINAGEITNKSALIEGTEQLTINAGNMTNTAITFTDVLKREMIASLFSRKWGDWLKTWYADEWRNFLTPFYETYVFSSQTVGEITGQNININLTGNLTIDENETPLVRAETVTGTSISTVYSNISGENVVIKADSIDNYGMISGNETLKITADNDFTNADAVIKGGDIEIETGGMFKSERQAIPLSGSNNGFSHISNYVNAYGLINASGKLNITSQDGVHVTGTNIMAMDGGSIYVNEGHIFMEALEYDDWWDIDKKINMADNKGSKTTDKISKGTLTIYNDFNLYTEKGDIKYEAYDIRGRGNLTVEAPLGNVIFKSKEAVEDYTFVLKMNMGWQGSEENRYSEYKSYQVGSTVEVMGKIEIVAGNNINILASSLESLSDVLELTAGMDVNVLAGTNYESAETVKIKTGSITIGGGDLASVSNSR